MTGDTEPRLPSLPRWQRLDALLDELLSLDAGSRMRRLDELGAGSPDLARRLKQLLEKARDPGALESTLSTALTSLAGGHDLPRQRRYGPWRLIEAIGQGGMGQVYLAERADGAYHQQAALKMMWPGLATAATARHFERERQLLANMSDPRIARLLDGGVGEDGRPWLVMELVSGRPITDYCRQQGLSGAERLSLFLQVTGAASAAHRRLAVHGDIKPGNVLVGDGGQVKLLDFGIGRLLESTTDSADASPALTLRYASPEQLKRQPITTASDVYQLGALLHRLLADTRWAHDRDLRALIGKAMADDPEYRYASVDAMESDLRAWLEHRPVTAREGGGLYRLGCLLRRRRLGSLSVMAVAAALLAAVVVHQRQAERIALEASVSQSVTAFLESMLHAADPYAGDNQVRVPDALLEEAVARADAELVGQPRVRARILNVLGEVHRSRGEASRALELFERAGGLARRHDLPEEGSRSRAGIAVTGIWSGDYERAERALRQVLAEQEERYGSEAKASVHSRLRLADLLHSRGHYDPAAVLARQVLAGSQEPAWAHRVMGMILRDQGRFDEAETHLAKALALERAQAAPRGDMMAIVLEHYGQLRLYTGDPQTARSMLEEALAIRSKLLGADWSGLVWTQHWLGLTALAEGRLEQARQLLEITVANYRLAFSESSHLLAIARSDLGWVMLALDRPGRARELFSSASDTLESVQEGDHPRLAEALLGQALVEVDRGDPETARALSERALMIRRKRLAATDPNHPWIGSACRVHRLAGGKCSEAGNTDRRWELSRIETVVASRGLAGRKQPRNGSWSDGRISPRPGRR